MTRALRGGTNSATDSGLQPPRATSRGRGACACAAEPTPRPAHGFSAARARCREAVERRMHELDQLRRVAGVRALAWRNELRSRLTDFQLLGRNVARPRSGAQAWSACATERTRRPAHVFSSARARRREAAKRRACMERVRYGTSSAVGSRFFIRLCARPRSGAQAWSVCGGTNSAVDSAFSRSCATSRGRGATRMSWVRALQNELGGQRSVLQPRAHDIVSPWSGAHE